MKKWLIKLNKNNRQLTKIELFMFIKCEQKREKAWKSLIHMWIKIWSECNEKCEL